MERQPDGPAHDVQDWLARLNICAQGRKRPRNTVRCRVEEPDRALAARSVRDAGKALGEWMACCCDSILGRVLGIRANVQLKKYNWKRLRAVEPCAFCYGPHKTADCPLYGKNGRKRPNRTRRHRKNLWRLSLARAIGEEIARQAAKDSKPGTRWLLKQLGMTGSIR